MGQGLATLIATPTHLHGAGALYDAFGKVGRNACSFIWDRNSEISTGAWHRSWGAGGLQPPNIQIGGHSPPPPPIFDIQYYTL